MEKVFFHGILESVKLASYSGVNCYNYKIQDGIKMIKSVKKNNSNYQFRQDISFKDLYPVCFRYSTDNVKSV